MSFADERARRLRLEAFIDDYGTLIGAALTVYAERFRKEAEPLQERYLQIKDDAAEVAKQDKTWITTSGLRDMAGLFSQNADRADKAAKALTALEEEELPEEEDIR